MNFTPFPKIPRLSRLCAVTEKIDGTNASVLVTNEYDSNNPKLISEVAGLGIFAGSRTRWITPDDDNFSFAKWVHIHDDELVKLGPGHHFGEWWGRGIQRHYGLSERRFSLFNVGRWTSDFIGVPPEGLEKAPECCHVVPTLYRGEFDTARIDGLVTLLGAVGSFAEPGFMDAEGIIVYHEAGSNFFKKTVLHDDEPKNAHPKKERLPQEHKPKNPGGRRVLSVPINFLDRRRVIS